MNIADFQNPIANMPLMQQMQQAQHQQSLQTPIVFNQAAEQEVNQELTTVRQAEEQEEKDRINEEDERGFTGRGLPKRRAKKMDESDESDESKPRSSDGIHGLNLDIQA